MDDKLLDVDLNCHVIYSDVCKRIIQEKIALHYPDNKEAIWEKVQQQYVNYLKKWRTDLGGKKNYHNAQGGTYDSIAMMCYWVVCKEKTDIKEVEEMMNALFLPSFKKISFVDINKEFWKKILYFSFKVAAKKCSKWPDYDMRVQPYKKGEPIRYEFKACPIAQFACEFGLQEIMPAMCNPDYAGLAYLSATLIRKGNCCSDDKCDYTITANEDELCQQHPQYVDEKGYIRNR